VLAVSYVEGMTPGDRDPDRERALRLASRWFGSFHGDHYLSWAHRTSALAGDLHDSYPWLGAACRGYERLVEHLVTAAPTVVHGDYYLDNVLIGGGRVVPVDWEWAAIGAGEIDLAALTFRWPKDVVDVCERTTGPPAGLRAHRPTPISSSPLRACTCASATWESAGRSCLTSDVAGVSRRCASLSERLGLLDRTVPAAAPGVPQ
jgi:aminoglycoside phosphotransferase (APT) family kinase protein